MPKSLADNFLVKKKFVWPLVAIAAVVGLFLFLREDFVWSLRYWREAKASVKPPAMAPLPDCVGCNVVLVSLDTVRADRMGFLGSTTGLTPNLDKISQHSVVFNNAFTNACFTTPSHMTLFTSLYPQVHGTETTSFRRTDADDVYTDHPLDNKYVTMAELLRKSGYRTHWLAPQALRYFSPQDGFMRGFDTVRPPAFPRGVPVPNVPYENLKVSEVAKSFARKDKPAFVFLHSYLAHSPYYLGPQRDQGADPMFTGGMLDEFKNRVDSAPEVLVFQGARRPASRQAQDGIVAACTNFEDLRECFRRFTSDAFWHGVGQWQSYRLAVRMRALNPNQLEHEAHVLDRAYDRGIAELDRNIGDLWSYLEENGLLKNTLVIFFSDHGEQLFEHGAIGHATFYEHTARVPLMIYHPQVSRGQIVAQKISLVDVLPMLTEMLKIEPPPQMQGKAPWHGEPEFVSAYSMGLQMVRDDRWKLIKSPGGREELYYLPLDPFERNDLMGLRNPWVKTQYRRLDELRRNLDTEMAL